MVALGLGGVLTEVLKDVTYRVAPFDLETAREMIAELRARQAVRGLPRQAGRRQGGAGARRWWPCRGMAVALAPRLKELDINPVFVRPAGQGVVAADALVVLEVAAAGAHRPKLLLQTLFHVKQRRRVSFGHGAGRQKPPASEWRASMKQS